MKVSTKHLAISAVLAIGALTIESEAGGYSTKSAKDSIVIKNLPVIKNIRTYGIVTDVSGRVVAINPKVLEVHEGDGIKVGQVVWVEDSVKFQLSSVSGAEVTVVGPGVVEFKAVDRIRIHSGAVRLKSLDGANQYFESPLMAGQVSFARTAYDEAGLALIWVARQSAQILAYSGDVSVWHPHLEKARVLLPPGYFTESHQRFTFLQPTKPKFVAEEQAFKFASLFDLENTVVLPYWKQVESKTAQGAGKGRAPATATAGEPLGEPYTEPHAKPTRDSYKSVVTREVVETHMLKRLRGEATADTYAALVQDKQKRDIARAKKISDYKSRFLIKKEKHLSKEDEALVNKIEEKIQ